MATAGELLARIYSERPSRFEEQSKRQLGGYCTEFSTEGKETD